MSIGKRQPGRKCGRCGMKIPPLHNGYAIIEERRSIENTMFREVNFRCHECGASVDTLDPDVVCCLIVRLDTLDGALVQERSFGKR